MKKTSIVPAGPDVARLADQKRQASELVDFLRAAPCESPAEESWFSASLSSVRGLLKGLEDERTSLTKPLLESKRRIDAMFTGTTTPLKQAEGVIREKLAGAARLRLAAETAARLAAETAAAEGRHADVIDALASAPDAVSTSGSSARVVKKWRVVDFARVPDEYKLVDECAVGATKGAKEIPGIEWYDDVAVRAK